MSQETQKESLRKFNQYMQNLLPKEELEKFQKIGKKLYNSFDAQKGELLVQQPDSIRLEESLAYIVESLKSGLHPKYLNYDEVHLLKAAYGESWFKKWDYEVSDIPEGFVVDSNSDSNNSDSNISK